jgi:cephalosporin-C deacetylase
MNVNLAVPYGMKCSPPQKPELVFFSPQSEDLLFEQETEIDVRCQAGVRSVGLQWTLARNMFATPFRTGAAEPQLANRFRIRLATAGLHPGFYDLRVTLDAGTGEPIEGICTFGYRVADMPICDTRPADFTAFWTEARTRLADVPLAAESGPVMVYAGREIDDYNVLNAALPGDYDPAGHRCETVESCKVSFAEPAGGRVYGWLAKPLGSGPFPAMLVLPGAGFAARPRPLEHARHGYVTLDIQVHGQDVDLPDYPRLPGYYDTPVFEPATAYYYYNVHLRLIQAINYLVSRPDVDPNRIVVAGGSQGGRLGIVAAGLDTRIAAVVSSIAHFANQPYHAWKEACNQTQSRADDMAAAETPVPADSPEARCLPYFDPMNYAPDIHCPVLMTAGLIDPVSPPNGVFAVYNRLGTADKQIAVLPGLGHDWSAELDRRAWRWLAERLNSSPDVSSGT